MKVLLAALFSAFFCVHSAAAGPDRISFLLASYHVHAKTDFEEINLGAFMTWESSHLDYTLGAYRNSYGRNSVAALLEYPFLDWRGGELSIFAGAALYPQNGRNFPFHIGDVVPMGGLQLRHKNLVFQAIPSDGNVADAILTVGFSFPIAGSSR